MGQAQDNVNKTSPKDPIAHQSIDQHRIKHHIQAMDIQKESSLSPQCTSSKANNTTTQIENKKRSDHCLSAASIQTQQMPINTMSEYPNGREVEHTDGSL